MSDQRLGGHRGGLGDSHQFEDGGGDVAQGAVLDRLHAVAGADDDELYSQEIPDSSAYDFLSDRIPLLDCPDKNIEKTYYFRWWTLRKHWKNTP